MLERRKKLKKIMSLQEKELKKMEEKLKKAKKNEETAEANQEDVRRQRGPVAVTLLGVPRCIAYLDAEHDMGFTAMRSERRSWIVGVGGFPDLGEDREQTIVFDCKTGVVAKGPRPRALKVEPVLFCVGEKIYALTSRPSARVPDRPPWFEVLDLSGASCVNGRLRDCSWRPLSPPPLFPILDEKAWFQISGGSSVQVESYAVVSHYILLSIVRDPFTLEDQCTLAFDTLAEEWYYVDKQKNLPFIGEAIPYGRLFLGRSRDKQLNDLTAYIISVTKTSTSSPILSILEVPVSVAMSTEHPVIDSKFLSCLGNGVICAIGCHTEDWIAREHIEWDKIYINIHSPINEVEEPEAHQPGEIVLSNNPCMNAFSVGDSDYQLIAPPLVAALCMHTI